jgi:hypothetical protein
VTVASVRWSRAARLSRAPIVPFLPFLTLPAILRSRSNACSSASLQFDPLAPEVWRDRAGENAFKVSIGAQESASFTDEDEPRTGDHPLLLDSTFRRLESGIPMGHAPDVSHVAITP